MIVPRKKPEIIRARELRRDMSRSEQLLWKRLRNHQLGFHFRRQHPFEIYMLDFYCNEARLCIEVDGEQHGLRLERDDYRDRFLDGYGLMTFRVASLQLYENLNEIVEFTYRLCCERSGREGLPPP